MIVTESAFWSPCTVPSYDTHKRNRKASGNGGGSNERISDSSEDQVEVEVEREGSPDDFEEFRPRAKRNRASETTTLAPQNSNQSLIDLKQSAFNFRQAAGVFHYLAQEVIPHIQPATVIERPPEATSSVSSAMSLICLADAQAVYIRRAEERGATGFGVLSKLHHGVAELLGEATGCALQSGTGEGKSISSRFLGGNSQEIKTAAARLTYFAGFFISAEHLSATLVGVLILIPKPIIVILAMQPGIGRRRGGFGETEMIISRTPPHFISS